jgi:hypothetical protein
MNDLIIKPNINAFDAECATSIERRAGTVTIKFHTAKGVAGFTYKNGNEVRRVLYGLEAMLNRIDEGLIMPGVMEERIKELRKRTAGLSINLEVALVDGVSRPQFIVVVTLDREKEVLYETPPFEFLAQSITDAEEVVRKWADHKSDNNNEQDAPHTE